MNFSNTLDFIIKSGEGYRNIGFSSGETNLYRIINFELNELCNYDIFYFMKNNYNDYNIDSIKSKDELVIYTVCFIEKLLNANKINDLKGVWLTTYQDVLNIYCNEKFPENINIIKVNIHENKMIPISDLGRDGALFAYAENFYSESVV